MKKSIRTKTITAITVVIAAITALAILAAGCGDSSVNSGNESKNLNRFLDVFSKNPGQNDSGTTRYTLNINTSPVDGGTVSRSSSMDSYRAGTSVTVTAVPNPGYVFIGWSGALNTTNLEVKITMNGDRWLTAGFKKDDDYRPTYNVSFNANGADGDPPDPTRAVSGNNITLPDRANMKKPGYRLTGWIEDSPDKGTFYETNASYTVTHNATLYAKWIPVYTVTFNRNGATGRDTAVTADSGAVIRLLDQGNIITEDFSLCGWITETRDKYNILDNYTVTGNVTLYACWERKYRVAFDGNGATIEKLMLGDGSEYYYGDSKFFEERHYYGSVITIHCSAYFCGGWRITKDGFYFEGWNTEPDGSGADYPTGSSYVVTHDVTFYAKWTAITHTLTINVSPSGGGSVSRSPNQTSYTSGTSVTVIATAASGYTFTGWSGASTSTNSSVTITMNGDKTLTAVFELQNVSQSVNGYTFEMVPVAAGTFEMGCTSEQGGDCNENEKPSHSVTLSSYYIGKYEVTQGLWTAVMGNLPTLMLPPHGGAGYGGDNYSVYYVSWNDIVDDFIPKLNELTGKTYRLPTEAEWEYAARGGNKSAGYKYSGSNTIGNVAWYADNSIKTYEVGTKSPNELGIYDMSGNVLEWVSDWYRSYSSGAQTDPSGPISGSYRVYRGGSWSVSAKGCRVSNRDGNYPGRSYNFLGFRLVSLSP